MELSCTYNSGDIEASVKERIWQTRAGIGARHDMTMNDDRLHTSDHHFPIPHNFFRTTSLCSMTLCTSPMPSRWTSVRVRPSFRVFWCFISRGTAYALVEHRSTLYVLLAALERMDQPGLDDAGELRVDCERRPPTTLLTRRTSAEPTRTPECLHVPEERARVGSLPRADR